MHPQGWRSFRAQASSILTTMHMRGRAITLSVLLSDWTHFAVVHVDPPWLMSRRVQLLNFISVFLRRVGGGTS